MKRKTTSNFFILRQLLPALLLCSSIFSYGQKPYNQQENFLKANSVWAFGENAGVDFNSGNPTAIRTAMFVGEGSASVADPKTGELLFYSDGRKCWNRNNQVMPNGDSLLGNGGSTTQGVCIVPMVHSPGKYYLFSLYGPTDYGDTIPHLSGTLFYSMVDMSLNNGLGDIVKGKKNILLSSEMLSESMIAIPGDNCNDIWLMVHNYMQVPSSFIAYHITSNGLDTVPVISNTPNAGINGSRAYQVGQMAVSPDRSMIAIASGATNPQSQGALIAKFNATTGSVSNPLLLTSSECYGICFSPDNSKVYVSGRFSGGSGSALFNRHIRQYDISVYDSAAAASSAVLVDSNTQHIFLSYLKLYNGKVYCPYFLNGFTALSYPGAYGLSCINSPNLSGIGCNYDSSAVVLFLTGTKAGIDMSNDVVFPLTSDTVHQKVLDTTICSGSNYTLEGSSDYSSYRWDDGSTNQNREVTQSGTYWVLNKDECHYRVDTFVIRMFDLIPPVISVDSFTLRTATSYATYQWLLNGNIIPGATDSTYAVTENGNYQVIVSNELGCIDTSAAYPVTNVTGMHTIQSLAMQIKIYPNPAHNMVYINAPVPVNFYLCSIQGKILKQVRKSNRVSLQGLAEGIYFLQIYDQKNRLIKTEKIIKTL